MAGSQRKGGWHRETGDHTSPPLYRALLRLAEALSTYTTTHTSSWCTPYPYKAKVLLRPIRNITYRFPNGLMPHIRNGDSLTLLPPLLIRTQRALLTHFLYPVPSSSYPWSCFFVLIPSGCEWLSRFLNFVRKYLSYYLLVLYFYLFYMDNSVLTFSPLSMYKGSCNNILDPRIVSFIPSLYIFVIIKYIFTL